MPSISLASTADAARDIPRPQPRVASTAVIDDGELVAACRRGERRAMEALYHQYKRRVFGLCHRIVGPSDAEEVAQDVFVRVFRGLASFRGDSALGTWVYRLAVNAALTHAGKQRRRAEVSDDVLEHVAAPGDVKRDPGLSGKVEQALARLPAGYRAILVLHDVEGLSHEECAAILDCRIGTTKSQLHKARARMRDLLGPALAAERAGGLGLEPEAG
ncbi:MAG TPA: sigma-70 family RNA polymerase sigma factor [Kofleriaceae bacterium]|nr:sigma-70 family RNA polymerase sigma factor [Kofleriaceae bacterium]